MVMKHGMVGKLNGERVVLWGVSVETAEEVEKEVRGFVFEFRVLSDDLTVNELCYCFSETGKNRHQLVMGDQCFCYTFSTGRLTRVPWGDVYESFWRAF